MSRASAHFVRTWHSITRTSAPGSSARSSHLSPGSPASAEIHPKLSNISASYGQTKIKNLPIRLLMLNSHTAHASGGSMTRKSPTCSRRARMHNASLTFRIMQLAAPDVAAAARTPCRCGRVYSGFLRLNPNALKKCLRYKITYIYNCISENIVS